MTDGQILFEDVREQAINEFLSEIETEIVKAIMANLNSIVCEVPIKLYSAIVSKIDNKFVIEDLCKDGFGKFKLFVEVLE